MKFYSSVACALLGAMMSSQGAAKEAAVRGQRGMQEVRFTAWLGFDLHLVVVFTLLSNLLSLSLFAAERGQGDCPTAQRVANGCWCRGEACSDLFRALARRVHV
jgi:hypothetical protein